MSTMSQAFARGARIAATGDTRVAREMAQDVQSRNLVVEAWSSVGQAMSRAMEETPKPRRAMTVPLNR